MKKRLSVLITLLFCLYSTVLSQDEFIYLGLTPAQARNDLGQPTSEYESDYGKYTFYYKGNNESSMQLNFSALNDQCTEVEVVYLITDEDKNKIKRDLIAEKLYSIGFKTFKKVPVEDVIILFSSTCFARLDINYVGGNHSGFNDFQLTVTYLPTSININ